MSKEENIKVALQTTEVLENISKTLRKGSPVELKIEKDKLVVVDIERHAKVKVLIG